LLRARHFKLVNVLNVSAMAKTTKPVSLLIDTSLDGKPEMDRLREQGHVVDPLVESCMTLELHEYDLILGPNCWWLPPEHIDLLPTVLKAARETRYPPTEKKPTKRKKK